ncbi:hypothetical protein Y032_0049g1766 [Ancylostoma ceylanicum]|uniref:Uncharacterized protein n=1 Tax=Ancylostoma ceylanicum TaxID=53326 RepID=A0A016UA99_9BILA|nr:hypothetical protein Y032_0049g1766 [Ancylostoma ceylanicum]
MKSSKMPLWCLKQMAINLASSNFYSVAYRTLKVLMNKTVPSDFIECGDQRDLELKSNRKTRDKTANSECSSCSVISYWERQSRLPLPRPQHPRGAGETTPNIHSVSPRRVDVAATRVVIGVSYTSLVLVSPATQELHEYANVSAHVSVGCAGTRKGN